MSQQEMHYSETAGQQAEANYAGYDGLPPHAQPQFGAFYGQKLSNTNQSPSAGQRLALAIVSLAMMMLTIFGLIGVGIATNANVGETFGLIFVMVLFFTSVIVINALFNRRH